MFRKFIWNNGKARISLSQLQKDIPDWGLKLTDLVTFNFALKISWIKKLIKGIGNWQYIFEFTTGLNKTLVWDLDCLSLKKISENIKNQFWKEIVVAWKKYKHIYMKDIDVRSYPVWDTYFITNSNLLQIKKMY